MSYWNNSEKRIVTGAVVGGIAGVVLSFYADKIPDVRVLLNTVYDKALLLSAGTFAGILVGGMLGYDPVISDYNSRKRGS